MFSLLLFYQESESVPASPQAAPVVSLEGVVDDKPVEFEDQAAYYGLLDQAAKTSPATLRQQALEFVTAQQAAGKFKTLPAEQYPLFYEMLTRPHDFRGQPVLLKGHVLQVDAYDAGENAFGIKTLYECWLVTDDAQNHPCTVIFTEKPDKLRIGRDLRDNVEVAGYFLKTYTYPALDHRHRKAPLIMARTIVLRNPPQMEMQSARVVVWAICGLVIGGSALLVFSSWRTQRQLRALRQEVLAEGAPDFSQIQLENPEPRH